MQPLVELRAPFELDRQAIDDVERGAQDSDWQPVKDAARQLAFAEDRAIFDGYRPGRSRAFARATSNPIADAPRGCARLPGRDRPGDQPAPAGRASTARTGRS